LAYVSLGLIAWLVYSLGERWFERWIGAVAAAIVLTRAPFLSNGIRAYIDLPYIALCLGALYIEARKPRAGWPGLALLVLAGPLLWILFDAITTGDPLYSLTGTQETVETLQRKTGPVDLVLYGPRALGEVLQWPGMVGAAGGVVLGLAFLRRRSA